MTQHEQILQYIDTFGSITPMQAFTDLGITKLATRISEMSSQGMDFEKEVIYSKNRYGKPIHFMRYSKPIDMDAVNELCLKCGKYELEHEGACDGCKWLELKYERQ